MRSPDQLRLCGVLLLLAVACSAANAGPAHTALRSAVDMQTDTILLGNLLPERVSDELKHSVEKICLGSSPRLGSTRRVSRSTIVNALAANGLSSSPFDIPESIEVRRTGRQFTKRDVYAVIQASLSNNSSQVVPAFNADDIEFDSSIVVPESGARLKLTRVTYDHLLGEARFLLSPSGEHSTLPFYVTAKFPSPDPKASMGTRSSEPAEGLPPGAVLVEPKRAATLHLHSVNSETMLRVQPLIPGHLGEVIPVRLFSNRKTLRARVVGFGLLDAAF